MKTVHLDYEFRSGVNINDVGSHRASTDPEFEILMAAVSGEGVDDPVFLWVSPKFRTPDMMGQNEEAESLLNSADIVFAHNAPNEQANTWGAFAQGKACPFWKEPPLKIWRCTAAMARKAGLPGALGDVADFLGTPVRKDKRGKDLIKLFTQKNEIKPTKEAKKSGAVPIIRFIEPTERQDEFMAFGSYCCDDVRAEKHVHKRLRPFELSGAQLEMFQFDLRMNQRGIPINVDGARRAQHLVNRVQGVVVGEFRHLTGLNPTQRQKTQEWLFEHGCPMENMQATTVEAAIERMKDRENFLISEDAPQPEVDQVRLALLVVELYQKVSYSAVAKIATMLECVCPDGRVRGGHMFYGAGTGRWCLTGDHEVLTRDGWVRLDEWDGGEIAVWGKDEVVSFQKSKKVAFPFKGTMYHQQSQRIDQIATGDHRCPGWNSTTGQFEVRLAQSLVSGFQIPYTGWREKPYKTGHDELRLLVATQADGCFHTDGRLDFHLKKIRKIQRLVELLKRLSIPFTNTPNSDGSRNVAVKARHVPMFLVTFEHKTFGPWLLDVDAGVFFEELEQWDGYRCGPNSIQYSTTNKVNAEWVQALAHTSGLACTIIARKGKKANWKTCYAANIWLRPSNRNQLPSRPSKVNYNGMVYCASTKTGFFLVRRNGVVWVTGNSGKLLQPQNFKKCPPELKDITDAVYKAICDGWSAEMIDQIYGDPLEMLSICIRHFIFHPQYLMLDGDYNAVEARIICWLAGETEALDEYRNGVDRYQIMAAEIYRRDLAYIKSLGKDATERQVGKQAVLGAGFGLGRPEKFKETVKKQGGVDISLELAEEAIHAFRRKHKKIVAYWWQLDDLCKKAVRTPGSQFGPFVVKTIAGLPFLLFYLRSGRALAYPRPKIELFPWTPKKRKHTFDDDGYDDGFAPEAQTVIMRENVVYWGEIKPRIWGWIKLYGGKLAENETQATAADFMGHGAIEAERQGMEPFMLVHDQALALLADPERHTVDAFEKALGSRPSWAKGMPLKVEAKTCRYYRK